MDVIPGMRGPTARTVARIAGGGYLVIFVLALFANFFVLEGLIEPDDAAATAANIADSELLFRSGLVSFMVVFILDVAIAWALYVLFRPHDRDLSLLTAWFRLVYTVLLGVALISSFIVLELISGADHLSSLGVDQIDAQLMLFLNSFDYAWLIGLACFGVHLILLGYLALRSGTVPRWIGFLLVVAGIAYVVDTLANALLADYADVETVFLVIVAVPSLIGEFSFAVWLLMRGGKDEGPALSSAPSEVESALSG